MSMDVHRDHCGNSSQHRECCVTADREIVLAQPRAGINEFPERDLPARARESVTRERNLALAQAYEENNDAN